MSERVFSVEAASAKYASRNRVIMAQAAMVEMGIGIGDHLQLSSIPVSESRSRRGTRDDSESDEETTQPPRRAFGIAWPGITSGHSSTF